MPAYAIVMMRIDDVETYKKYTDKTPAIIKKHGGKFLTRGEAVDTFEGTPYEDRMVIVEFPDKKSAESWYNDPEYQEAMKFRKASSFLHQLLVQEGGESTGNPNPKL